VAGWQDAGMTIRQSYLAAAGVAAAFLRAPAVAEAWDEPSALAKMSVGGLAAHLARQIILIPGVLTAPPAEEAPIGLLEHYARAKWRGADLDDEANASIRANGELLAQPGAQAIAEQAAAALAELTSLLAAEDPDRAIYLTWTGWALTVDSLLTTRTLEIVVHTDDLAASLGLPTPQFPTPVVETVIDLLSRLAVQRHGAVAVLRALSRAERAPATIAAI